jgi:hypothetical protein
VLRIFRRGGSGCIGDRWMCGGIDNVDACTGERRDSAYVSDCSSRGDPAVYRDSAEHQQYGGDLASERSDRRQRDGWDNFEFGSVHRTRGGSEPGYGNGDSRVSG